MKIHERYDDVTFENDIAILKLNGVATRSGKIFIPKTYLNSISYKESKALKQ